MNGKTNWQAWRKWIGAGVGVLLVAGLVVAVLLWQLKREGGAAMQAQRNSLATQAKLLRADVARGESIREHLPAVGRECDRFYKERFLPATTAYSEIESDLAHIAAKAGLKTSGISFQQKEVKDRGVTQIQIVATVEGPYTAILQLISGLERSKNFYSLDNLELDSASSGGIRLRLQLNTYFRT